MVAQGTSQGFAHEDEVPILTEHQRDHHPVNGLAGRTIGPHESIEPAFALGGNIWCSPRVVALLSREAIGVMREIALSKQ